MSPSSMNEAQTRYNYIDPALRDAGWETAPAKIAVEQTVAPGRVEADGRSHSPLRADYVLMYAGRRIAVVEAKKYSADVGEGETQARFYAKALGVRFAYCTNGRSVRSIDLALGTTSDVEFMVFPTPQELLPLLAQSDGESELERRARQVPWAKPGGREVRYYQERAVESVIRVLGRGGKNALVTLATGTGKTMIAFQIVWKLMGALWSKAGFGVREPRVLFLADRNILADQAMETFDLPPGKCYRLHAATDEPPLDRSVYFTLYQTLMGKGEGDDIGEGELQVKYTKFRRDFFDLVIIDECHRGGANDESAWRAILDYFSSASHLGLTATPKCDDNGSTYEYFGKPAYEYSLAQGIADGFLSPYRVKLCESTIREYGYVEGDLISDPGAVDLAKTYSPDEIERARIVIRERDAHFAEELFTKMPPREKAIVFCATQAHAQRMAEALRKEAKKRFGIVDSDYCVRVTAEDAAAGEQYLKRFRDNDSTLPTILTTSQKLTTGVDACNVRSIVLLKEVKSMVEFKQIIGRGTRRYDGKAYFTIYDFTGATKNFRDEGWDGPVVCAKCGKNPCECETGGGGGGGGGGKPPRPCPVCGCNPCVCPPKAAKPITVTLSSGRSIAATWTESILFDNEMMTAAEFLDRFVKAVKATTGTSSDLLAKWQGMETRSDLLEAMAMRGFTEEKLREVQEKTNHSDDDILDVMMDIAYAVEPVTREMRAAKARKSAMEGECRAFREVILENYVNGGVWTLTEERYSNLLKARYSTLPDAFRALGFANPLEAGEFYAAIQREIYAA